MWIFGESIGGMRVSITFPARALPLHLAGAGRPIPFALAEETIALGFDTLGRHTHRTIVSCVLPAERISPCPIPLERFANGRRLKYEHRRSTARRRFPAWPDRDLPGAAETGHNHD